MKWQNIWHFHWSRDSVCHVSWRVNVGKGVSMTFCDIPQYGYFWKKCLTWSQNLLATGFSKWSCSHCQFFMFVCNSRKWCKHSYCRKRSHLFPISTSPHRRPSVSLRRSVMWLPCLDRRRVNWQLFRWRVFVWALICYYCAFHVGCWGEQYSWAFSIWTAYVLSDV